MRYKRALMTRAVLACGMSVMLAPATFAQASTGQTLQRNRATVASDPSPLWSGENDPADPRLPAAPPYTSFDRYTFTEECAKSVVWNQNKVWSTRRRDSVAFARTGNPYDSSAVDAGRRCLAHFTIPLTPTPDPLGLGATDLAVNNDSAAAAAFARAEHEAASLSLVRRAWVKAFIIEVYLDAAQPRVAAAAAMQQELDAMGAPAAIPQMMGHIHLAQEGMRSDSVALWDSESRAAIAAIKRATPEDRREYALDAWEGYWLLIRARLRVGDVAGAQAAVESLRADLVPIQPFSQGRANFAAIWVARHVPRVSPIRATQWVNIAGPADTVYPRRGHVTLVMFAAADCGYRCVNQYAMIRRLADRFGASLDIVFLTRTLGFYGERLVAPDSEISLIRHRFVDQLHLPVRVAIWKTAVHRRDDDAIEPDGPLPNETAYPMAPSDDPVIEIVGPDGACRLITEFIMSREVLIADVIREELARAPK